MKIGCSIPLNRKDVWESETIFEKTVLWYKNFYENNAIGTIDDLKQYILDAKKKNLEWSMV